MEIGKKYWEFWNLQENLENTVANAFFTFYGPQGAVEN